MTHGSLFTGIGGIDLGFEWAGIETKWQVEIDDYCQKLLSVRFPHTEKFTDVRKVGSHNLEKVDIISGGFPCQDISVAGKGAGIEGERSGLWSELHRIIGELRPRFAFIENVPMLTIRGGVRVIADLAEIGYDAEWQVVGADDVGAWHRRKRIWIVAYPRCDGRGNLQQRSIRGNGTRELAQEIDRHTKTVKTSRSSAASKIVPNTDNARNRTSGSGIDKNRQKKNERRKKQSQFKPGRHGENVPNAEHNGPSTTDGQRKKTESPKPPRKKSIGEFEGRSDLQDVPNSESKRQPPLKNRSAVVRSQERQEILRGSGNADGIRSNWQYWSVEPNVGRVAHGIPKRVDRLKGLGNAVVPQIPYIIGKRLKELCQENQAEKH